MGAVIVSNTVVLSMSGLVVSHGGVGSEVKSHGYLRDRTYDLIPFFDEQTGNRREF